MTPQAPAPTVTLRQAMRTNADGPACSVCGFDRGEAGGCIASVCSLCTNRAVGRPLPKVRGPNKKSRRRAS